MAIYEYNPGNRLALQAESIALRGADLKDIERERHLLINAGMNAALRQQANQKEVTRQLSRAEPKRLPVELVSRLMDPEYYTAPVINHNSGLAMYAPRQEGKPNFALLSEVVENIEERVDSDTFEHLASRDEITHDALQFEPYITGGQLKVRAHDSFGYMAGRTYIPVVTVLNGEHPVRQLIEQTRQG